MSVFCLPEFSLGDEVYFPRPLDIGAIDVIADTHKFNHCGLLPHCLNFRFGMPQQVSILYDGVYLGINERFGAWRPYWRHRMCDHILSIDEGLEGYVAAANF